MIYYYVYNRSSITRYIWYIREKIVKNSFSPEKLNILLETFVQYDDTIEPDTAEWYEIMIKHWNNTYKYYIYIKQSIIYAIMINYTKILIIL